MNNKNLVYKHNDIIEGKYSMTLTEAKVIAKLTSLIRKEDSEFNEYEFKSQTLLSDLGLRRDDYKILKQSIRRLISRIIEIKVHENDKLITTFLSSCLYYSLEGESRIKLSFDPKLKPYFLQLKKNFTMYRLENVLSLCSFYSIRIYELLKQRENLKKREIKLEELKKFLDVESKYKKYSHFKERILQTSKREINKKTDLLIDFEEIKRGKKVFIINFIIKQKEYIKKIETEYKKNNKVEELFKILPYEEQLDIRKKELKKLVKIYNFELLKSDIKYCKKNYTTNFWGYFLKSLKEEHFSKAELEKKDKKEAKQNEEKQRQEELIYNELKEIQKEYIEIQKDSERIKQLNLEYNKLPKTIKKNVNFEIFIRGKISEKTNKYK